MSFQEETKIISCQQLNLLVVATYAGKYFEVRIFDEDIDLEVPADLVGITIMTSTALRGYEIAGLFQKRGVHVFLLPEEATALCRFLGQRVDSS